jgi:hypothetical protein
MKEYIPENSIPYYVNPKLLQVIHREMNLDYKVGVPSQRNTEQNKNDNDDDIRDDIAYGTYED